MDVEFFKLKFATFGVILCCTCNLHDRISLIKQFSEESLRITSFDLRNFNESSLFEILNGSKSHFGIVLEGDCLLDSINLSIPERFFFENYHWLIKSTNKARVLTYLGENAPLNVNSDVILAISSENSTVFQVYNSGFYHNGHLHVENLGNYDHVDGFVFKKPLNVNNKYWDRKNMTNVRFKSGIVIPNQNIPMEEYLNSDQNRQDNSMHRFQSVTVRYCQEFYNFSMEMVRTNSWGYKRPSGNFDGLVGLLERKEVDFGSSPLLYKLDRMPVIDYSYGNWILKSTFIYRRPKVNSASYEIFLRPLSQSVWFGIVALMGVTFLFLKLIFTRETRIFHDDRDFNVDSSWSFLFLFVIGTFCQQGATCCPKFLSSRIISIFVLLFCILIYQFYSASIVSYLLMDPPRAINNLRDLLRSNLLVGIEDILIDRNYFVDTRDPIALELFDKKIKSAGNSNESRFYQALEGLDLVKSGGFAFHVETSTAYPIIEEIFTNQEICELEEVQMYRTQPMFANLQKNSPFKEMFNYCMLRMVESGNMDRLRKFWDARKPVCIESAKKVEIHVTIHEFSCGLIILSYGLLFSFIFFLGECLVVKIRRMKSLNVIKPFVN